MAATPRRREGLPRRKGPPRHGHARLGKPEDSGGGLSGLPRRRWAMPRCAYDFLRLVFMACFRSVSWPDL